MTEDEARNVELVRAVEVEDVQASLLTREDLAQADAHARAASSSLEGRRASEKFIAARAGFASARLATRHPGIARLLTRNRWPSWVAWALPLLALVLGFAANEFGTGKRLDLLAVPLLGTIAWNLAVYVWLIMAMVPRRTADVGTPLYRALGRIAGIGRRRFDNGTSLERAAAAFESNWAKASAALTGARVARTMNLGAALFAVGLILGIYLRALVIEYRAGWESTFLGPSAVHFLLTTILGPASWITGVPIPSVEGISAMRWTGAETGGVNAAPWIYLYTTTVVGLVVAPRLLLALWQGAKALRYSRRFPIAGREDFYIRRLIRSAEGAAGTVRVTSYAYRPKEETKQNLSSALRKALGDRAEVRFDEAIVYGEEDEWLSGQSADPEIDYHILLFTLSATPEEENHGALAASMAERMARERTGTILAALVDESPFRAHFAGQSGLEERVSSRLDSWRKALARSRVVPLGVDLSKQVDSDLAQRLESGLLPDGAMRG